MIKNIITCATICIAPNIILYYNLIHPTVIYYNTIQLIQYNILC